MSIYAVVNENEPAFFSSNSGWTDVIEFAQEQENELAVLCREGVSEDLAALRDSIDAVIGKAPKSVAKTLSELRDILTNEEGFVLISNGVVSDD